MRQLDKLMIEEDERELESTHRDWLDDEDGWSFAEECFITRSEEANLASVGQATDPNEVKDLDRWSGGVIFDLSLALLWPP